MMANFAGDVGMLVVLANGARDLPEGETLTVARVVERANALRGVRGVVSCPGLLKEVSRFAASFIISPTSLSFGLAVSPGDISF